MEQQDKRHIPHSSGAPHNLHTRPADSSDTDKLRENPHNDERIIAQNDESAKESNPDVKSGSTFARKDEEGTDRVTNEQEQDEVVNPQTAPTVVNAAKKDDDDDNDDDDDEKEAEPEKTPQPEIPAEPDYPTENPYEHIGDDPDVAQKKIPKF